MIGLMIRSRRDLVCQQAVELVTDYLDRRPFSGPSAAASRRTWRAAPDFLYYLAQMRAIIVLAGSITADDLTPHMRSDLTQPVPAMASR